MDIISVHWYGDNSTSVMLLPWEHFICLLKARDAHSVSTWQLCWTISISSTTKWKIKLAVKQWAKNYYKWRKKPQIHEANKDNGSFGGLAVVHDGKKQSGTGQEGKVDQVETIRNQGGYARGNGKRRERLQNKTGRQETKHHDWYIREEQHKTTERLGLVESVELWHCSSCTSAGSQGELEEVQGDFLCHCGLRLPLKAGIIMPTTQSHPSAEPCEHLLFWTHFLSFNMLLLSAQMGKVKPFTSRQCSMSATLIPRKGQQIPWENLLDKVVPVSDTSEEPVWAEREILTPVLML